MDVKQNDFSSAQKELEKLQQSFEKLNEIIGDLGENNLKNIQKLLESLSKTIGADAAAKEIKQLSQLISDLGSQKDKVAALNDYFERLKKTLQGVAKESEDLDVLLAKTDTAGRALTVYRPGRTIKYVGPPGGGIPPSGGGFSGFPPDDEEPPGGGRGGGRGGGGRWGEMGRGFFDDDDDRRFGKDHLAALAGLLFMTPELQKLLPLLRLLGTGGAVLSTIGLGLGAAIKIPELFSVSPERAVAGRLDITQNIMREMQYGNVGRGMRLQFGVGYESDFLLDRGVDEMGLGRWLYMRSRYLLQRALGLVTGTSKEEIDLQFREKMAELDRQTPAGKMFGYIGDILQETRAKAPSAYLSYSPDEIVRVLKNSAAISRVPRDISLQYLEMATQMGLNESIVPAIGFRPRRVGFGEEATSQFLRILHLTQTGALPVGAERAMENALYSSVDTLASRRLLSQFMAQQLALHPIPNVAGISTQTMSLGEAGRQLSLQFGVEELASVRGVLSYAQNLNRSIQQPYNLRNLAFMQSLLSYGLSPLETSLMSSLWAADREGVAKYILLRSGQPVTPENVDRVLQNVRTGQQFVTEQIMDLTGLNPNLFKEAMNIDVSAFLETGMLSVPGTAEKVIEQIAPTPDQRRKIVRPRPPEESARIRVFGETQEQLDRATAIFDERLFEKISEITEKYFGDFVSKLAEAAVSASKTAVNELSRAAEKIEQDLQSRTEKTVMGSGALNDQTSNSVWRNIWPKF